MNYYNRTIDILLSVFYNGIVFILLNWYFGWFELPKNLLSYIIVINAVLFMISAFIKKKMRVKKGIIIDNP